MRACAPSKAQKHAPTCSYQEGKLHVSCFACIPRESVGIVRVEAVSVVKSKRVAPFRTLMFVLLLACFSRNVFSNFLTSTRGGSENKQQMQGENKKPSYSTVKKELLSLLS